MAGELLMLHGSIRRLGLARSQGVERGADTLLDAVEAAVGAGGTLLMVLGSECPQDWINQRPIPERARLLANAPPFDGPVAAGSAELIDAADLVQFGARWMEQHLARPAAG